MKLYLIKTGLSKDTRLVNPGDVDALDWLTPEELAYHLLRGHVEPFLEPEPAAAPPEDETDKPRGRKRGDV